MLERAGTVVRMPALSNFTTTILDEISPKIAA